MRAVCEDAHGRAVGVLVARRQINGLHVGIAIARRAMGQEGFVSMGPERRVQRIDAFGRANLHDDAHAAAGGLFEQSWKHLVERLAHEVVEPNLGHD